MPLLRPPFYAQEKDSSCLPACLRMVLGAQGIHLPESTLRKLCYWTPHGAVSSRAVVAAARALGFIHSREDYGLRLHDLRDAFRAGVFPIVGIDLSSYGRVGQHAQVVVSVTSRTVRVLDPLLGPFDTGLLVFERAWSGSEFLTILIEE
ncbi:MAG TPA: cysteine peptidase family C39 domain-containing protein [Blastocatellia bacterium]|jgi:ABC-type bacteriocin/lantibiotic exporter with double-glycine peptidase domain|nr:cysteine peptidase family C39 domain-containing protein [Blastocatellia bacterium]